MARFTKKTFSHRNVSFSISNLRSRNFDIIRDDEVVGKISANVKTNSNLYDDADIQFKYGLDEETNSSIMEVFIEFINSFDLSVGNISQKIKSGSYKHCIPENINKKYFVCFKGKSKYFDFYKSKTFICKREQIDLIKQNGIDICFPVTPKSAYFVADNKLHGHVFASGFTYCTKQLNLIAYSPDDLKNITIDLNVDQITTINVYKKYDSDESLIFPKFSISSEFDINNISVMFFTELNQRKERLYHVDYRNVKTEDIIYRTIKSKNTGEDNNIMP